MSDNVVLGQDIPWLLRRQAERLANKPFLIWEPFEGEARTWSYEAFLDAAERVAGGLVAAGLRPGERLLLHAPNSPELLIAWFASAMIGSVAVTTNTAATEDEMAYFLANSEPRFAIVGEDLATNISRHSMLERIWTIAAESGESQSDVFAELIKSEPYVLPPRDDPRQDLAIQYTSGSTSKPKGVLWTHGNGIWGARVSALQQQLDGRDIYLVFLPFFHTNAQSYSVLATLWAGGTVILQPKFSASRFWPVALRHSCTRTSMVPFCLGALRRHAVPAQHAFRTWGLGVAHPEAELQFGTKFIGWWGMTETIAQAIVTDPNASHPFMSMGFPSLAYDLQIRDDQGAPLSHGAGKLWIKGNRGVSLFKEYFRNEAATAASFDANGWFCTGDRVRRAVNGDIFFEGRELDIIKCAGENIAPAEIEAVIAAVPGVVEVAVVGQRSRIYEEIPVAFVVGADSERLTEQIVAACTAKLSKYKIPRHVHFLESLPKAAIGKVAKGSLRSLLHETD